MPYSSLGNEFPRLAAQLAQVPDAEVGQAARRVVKGALDKNGLTVANTDRAAVEQLVWSLDDAAWQLQEQVEKGTATQVAYAQAFRRARAANSLLDLVEGRYSEAIYEATHALYADEEFALKLLVSDEGEPA